MYIGVNTLSQDNMAKNAATLIINKSANVHGFGHSLELLCIITAQEAARLSPLKVGGPNKMRPRLSHPYFLLSELMWDCLAQQFFSNLQLCQVTLLQPLELWVCIVSLLESPKPCPLSLKKERGITFKPFYLAWYLYFHVLI